MNDRATDALETRLRRLAPERPQAGLRAAALGAAAGGAGVRRERAPYRQRLVPVIAAAVIVASVLANLGQEPAGRPEPVVAGPVVEAPVDPALAEIEALANSWPRERRFDVSDGYSLMLGGAAERALEAMPDS